MSGLNLFSKLNPFQTGAVSAVISCILIDSFSFAWVNVGIKLLLVAKIAEEAAICLMNLRLVIMV